MTADFPSLIEQLAAESAQAKALLADVHAALKDMRAVLAESAAERKRLDETVKAAVDADVSEHVKAAVKELREATAKAIELAEKGVYKRFDTVANMLIHGDTKGNGPNILEQAATMRAAQARS